MHLLSNNIFKIPAGKVNKIEDKKKRDKPSLLLVITIQLFGSKMKIDDKPAQTKIAYSRILYTIHIMIHTTGL